MFWRQLSLENPLWGVGIWVILCFFGMFFSILINLQTPETTAQHDRATRGPGGGPKDQLHQGGDKAHGGCLEWEGAALGMGGGSSQVALTDPALWG